MSSSSTTTNSSSRALRIGIIGFGPVRPIPVEDHNQAMPPAASYFEDRPLQALCPYGHRILQ
ncbi:hypothetical protein CRG98_045166, partial [Punica granatum]